MRALCPRCSRCVAPPPRFLGQSLGERRRRLRKCAISANASRARKAKMSTRAGYTQKHDAGPRRIRRTWGRFRAAQLVRDRKTSLSTARKHFWPSELSSQTTQNRPASSQRVPRPQNTAPHHSKPFSDLSSSAPNIKNTSALLRTTLLVHVMHGHTLVYIYIYIYIYACVPVQREIDRWMDR